MKAGVCPRPAGEVKFRPGGDRMLTADVLAPVVLQAVDHHYLFGGVRTHPVVEYNVTQHFDARPLQGTDSGEIVRPCAVLGTDCALLIELTQVIHIVYIVDHAGRSGGTLIGGRQPDHIDADAFQLRRLGLRAFPVQLIIGQIPLEKLHHGFVCHNISPDFFYKIRCVIMYSIGKSGRFVNPFGGVVCDS